MVRMTNFNIEEKLYMYAAFIEYRKNVLKRIHQNIRVESPISNSEIEIMDKLIKEIQEDVHRGFCNK